MGDTSQMQKYAGIYNDIAQILGDEAAEKMFDEMKGTQVTFPTRLYSKEYVLAETMGIEDPYLLKKKAIELGYTERRIKQLIKKFRNEEKK